MRPRTSPVLVLVALLCGGAASARLVQHPDFSTSVRRPRSLAVLPPLSQMVRGKVNDAEPMLKESAAFEETLLARVCAELRTKGYAVDTTSLSLQALADDHELRKLVDAFMSRYGEAAARIEQRDFGTGRYAVGETALPLLRRTGADGLLVIRSQSIIQSKGRRALSMTLNVMFGGLPVPPPDLTLLEVGIVDGDEGRLSAYAVNVATGHVLTKPDHVADKATRATLRDLPARDEISRAGKRELKRRAKRGEPVQVAEAEEPEEAPSAADAEEARVLAEFDALYLERTGQPREAGPPPAPPPAPVAEAAVAEPTAPGAEPAPAQGETVALEGGPAPAEDPTARALLDVPEDARPAPRVQVNLVVAEGEPALALRNLTGDLIRVSVGLRAFVELPAGAEATAPVAEGSTWILVADALGREIGRLAVVIGGRSSIAAEIVPLATPTSS